MRVDVRGDAVAVVDGDVDVFRELGPHVACASRCVHYEDFRAFSEGCRENVKQRAPFGVTV